jgi:MFS family permease
MRQRSDIRRFVVANTCWEFTVAALKTFVVLFFTVGLDRSLHFTTLVLATVAVAAILAAPTSGWAGDRFGHRRVMEVALWVFAIGLLLPFATLSNWAFPGIAITAFAAVVVMTLPYSTLMDLMPEDEHGAAAGLFGFSRGLGTLLGPLVTGVVVETLQAVGLFQRTEGYIALFAVASAGLFLSLPFLRGMDRARPPR